MTTSETENPATVSVEEPEPKPMTKPHGAWDPNTPPTGAWDPNTPPTGAWDPNTPPPPTGAWDPNTPPTGAWDPNTPPPLPQPQPGNGQPLPQDDGGWVRDRVITHLLSSSDRPGVWAFVAGLGWKRLASVESGRSPLTGLAVLAKANGLAVSFREDAQGRIDQLLV